MMTTKTAEQIRKEIRELEADLCDPGDCCWVLGDPYEALDELRRQLARAESGLPEAPLAL